MIEIQARSHAESSGELELPITEIAHALDISTDELVEAIEAEEVGYRTLEAENGRLVIEFEACGKSCKLRVINQ
jgi:hypothetical protein